MIHRTRLVPFGLVMVLLAVSLAGCVTLFPKGEPVQFYRFGTETGPVKPRSSKAPQNVLSTQGSFSPGAAGDRLMAVSNGQVAYVRGVRWAAPAEDLLNDAVVQTFRARNGVTYLLQPGDPAHASYLLRYDVSHFELSYSAEPDVPPLVIVQLHATLIRARDGAVVAGGEFGARVQVAANRMAMFAPAYDRALSQALGDMADWVDRSVDAGS